MPVTLRTLWRFLGAASASGVSAGARRLGLAQSTVSASIKAIEEELGIRLFEPSPLGARLTAPGLRLRDHAFSLAMEVEQSLADLYAGRIGPQLSRPLVLAGAPAGSLIDWAAIAGALADARRSGRKATRLALAADAPPPQGGIRIGWRMLDADASGPAGAIRDEWRLLSLGAAAAGAPVSWATLEPSRLLAGPFGAADAALLGALAAAFAPAGPQFTLIGREDAALLLPASCLPAGLAAPGLRVRRVTGAPLTPWIVIETGAGVAGDAATGAEALAEAVRAAAAALSEDAPHPQLRSLDARVDLHCLRCFAATAEIGNTARAAAARGIVQPALSVQIRKLEGAARRTLFDRSSLGMATTPAGLRLYEMVAPTLAEHDAALARIRERASGPTPRRVQASLIPAAGEGSVIAQAAAEAISDWRAAHPEALLSVAEGFSTDQVRWLRGRIVDVALIDALDREPGLAIRPILKEPMALVLAPHSPWAEDGAPIEGRDLARIDLVMPSRRFGLRTLAERALGGIGLALAPSIEIDGLAVALRLVRTGRFGTILPASAVHEDIAARRLVGRRIVAPTIERQLCIAMRQEAGADPSAADLGARLGAAVRRMILHGSAP